MPDDELRIMHRKIFDNAKADALNSNDPYAEDYLNLTDTQIETFIEKSLPRYRNLYQYDLDNNAKLLFDTIKREEELAFFEPERYYISTFPTKSVNAFIKKSESGFLILLDIGLLDFLSQYTQLLFSLFAKISIERLDESAQMIAELALCYLTDTPVSEIRDRMPRTLGMSAQIQHDHYHNCMKFIIAHEIGHALGNHFDDSELVPKYTPNGDIEILNMSWAHEYEADIIGLKILLAESLYAEVYQNKFGNSKEAIASIMIFFSVDLILRKLYSFVKGNREDVVFNDTHPPSEYRIKNIENYLNSTNLKDKLQSSKGMLAWNSHLLNKVLEKVNQYS